MLARKGLRIKRNHRWHSSKASNAIVTRLPSTPSVDLEQIAQILE
jgi:hypothetical protein